MLGEYDGPVLVADAGGRGEAIVRALYAGNPDRPIIAAPGTIGTEAFAQNVAVGTGNISELLELAQDEGVELTIVGSEGPLAAGIVDRFEAAGQRILGPDREAAELESSKIWATLFMRQFNIPHPTTHIPDDFDDAVRFLKAHGDNGFTVIKADGLAGGKGVVVADSTEEALEAAEAMMVHELHGEAGKRILISKRIEGPEASIIGAVDKNGNYHLYPLSQDHKSLRNKGKGPNTGGMGAYAPADFIDGETLTHVKKHIIEPTIQGMRSVGRAFSGHLYIGIMFTEHGPMVIEYNMRLGDPETQVQLPLIATDFGAIAQACLAGNLDKIDIQHSPGGVVTVVRAAPGYPENPRTGQEVRGLDRIQDHPGVYVIHSGTKSEDGIVRVAGGRAVNIVGVGASVRDAHNKVYTAVYDGVGDFEGEHHRTDIASSVLS